MLAQLSAVPAENYMTPQQARLVADSLQKVLPVAGVTADLFYDHLFERGPFKIGEIVNPNENYAFSNIN